MTIKQIIEKGIQGGFVHGGVNDDRTDYEKIRAYVLIPSFWQAVGKVEGWSNTMGIVGGEEIWKIKMHQMIDALCEGKSAIDFIKTL